LIPPAESKTNAGFDRPKGSGKGRRSPQKVKNGVKERGRGGKAKPLGNDKKGALWPLNRAREKYGSLGSRTAGGYARARGAKVSKRTIPCDANFRKKVGNRKDDLKEYGIFKVSNGGTIPRPTKTKGEKDVNQGE